MSLHVRRVYTYVCLDLSLPVPESNECMFVGSTLCICLYLALPVSELNACMYVRSLCLTGTYLAFYVSLHVCGAYTCVCLDMDMPSGGQVTS